MSARVLYYISSSNTVSAYYVLEVAFQTQFPTLTLALLHSYYIFL